LCLIEQHPWNGVGVRGFRHAYPDCAAADDRFLDRTQDIGALHAHQWMLEVLSETGGLGLICWVHRDGRALRAGIDRPAAERQADVLAPSLAIAGSAVPRKHALRAVFELSWLAAVLAAGLVAGETPGRSSGARRSGA
jgi:O-antigen ligase